MRDSTSSRMSESWFNEPGVKADATAVRSSFVQVPSETESLMSPRMLTKVSGFFPVETIFARGTHGIGSDVDIIKLSAA